MAPARVEPKLVRENESLFLLFSENSVAGSVGSSRRLEIDFVKDRKKYLRTLRGKQELIAKAIGLGSRKPLTVFDATLGLAEDAWTMARLGARVIGCEREKMLAAVLQDAHERASRDSKAAAIAERISIHQGDAIEFLKDLPKSEYPDTIYLDPMFPESKKTALPRLEMQLFRQWLGEDQDIEKLFAVAMEKAKWRVVVKRSLKAPMVHPNVTHQFKGTSIRYDLYQPGHLHR